VVIDPRITATSRLADYVIAPPLMYERADSTMLLEGMFQQPFAHVTEAGAPVPAGSDLVEEWYALFRLANQAGYEMQIMGVGLNPSDLPSSERLIERVAASSRVPFDQLARCDGGLLVPAAE